MNNGRFKKGDTPYNKGLKRGSVSKPTEFKKGREPHNFGGVGVPRCSGARRETVVLTNEREPSKSRGKDYIRRKRIPYARHLWVQHHGEIEAGHIIYNNSTDPEDIQIQNLEMISRAELMRRNSRSR